MTVTEFANALSADLERFVAFVMASSDLFPEQLESPDWYEQFEMFHYDCEEERTKQSVVE